MSFKSILTHVVADPAGVASLRAAHDLAALLDAHLVGVGAEAIQGGGRAAVDGEPKSAAAQTRMASAEALFRGAVTDLRGGSTWLQAYQAPLRVLSRHAGLADLVVGYRGLEVDDPRRAAPLDGVLIEVGSPVLVSKATSGLLSMDRVMVAWDNSRECRRAITDSLPLLSLARAVDLVAVGLRPDDEAALKEALVRLGRHGVAASPYLIDRDWRAADVAVQLNDAAADLNADLIVLGAYGRSHLREWAFGGVTQAMLGSAERPLFFSR